MLVWVGTLGSKNYNQKNDSDTLTALSQVYCKTKHNTVNLQFNWCLIDSPRNSTACMASAPNQKEIGGRDLINTKTTTMTNKWADD